MDKNGSGRISMTELGTLMEDLGKQKPTSEDLKDLMEELDDDKSGGVEFNEFLKFMTK